jgi:hypothetical protein
MSDSTSLGLGLSMSHQAAGEDLVEAEEEGRLAA